MGKVSATFEDLAQKSRKIGQTYAIETEKYPDLRHKTLSAAFYPFSGRGQASSLYHLGEVSGIFTFLRARSSKTIEISPNQKYATSYI